MENEELEEDGVLAVHMINSICSQSRLMDDVMAARIKRMKSEQYFKILTLMQNDPFFMAQIYQRMLQIISNAYQICECHDTSDDVLDVLNDPENVTDEQVNAMLPYYVDEL